MNINGYFLYLFFQLHILIDARKKICYLCVTNNPDEAIYWDNIDQKESIVDTSSYFVEERLSPNISITTTNNKKLTPLSLAFDEQDMRWEHTKVMNITSLTNGQLVSFYMLENSEITFSSGSTELINIPKNQELPKKKWIYARVTEHDLFVHTLNHIVNTNSINIESKNVYFKKLEVSTYILNSCTQYEIKIKKMKNNIYKCVSFFALLLTGGTITLTNIKNNSDVENNTFPLEINGKWKYTKICSQTPLINFSIKINLASSKSCIAYINQLQLSNPSETRYIKYETDKEDEKVVCVENGLTTMTLSKQKYKNDCNLRKSLCNSDISYICCNGICYEVKEKFEPTYKKYLNILYLVLIVIIILLLMMNIWLLKTRKKLKNVLDGQIQPNNLKLPKSVFGRDKSIICENEIYNC